MSSFIFEHRHSHSGTSATKLDSRDHGGMTLDIRLCRCQIGNVNDRFVRIITKRSFLEQGLDERCALR